MVKYVELSPSLWGYIRRCLKTLQDPDTYLGLVIGHCWDANDTPHESGPLVSIAVILISSIVIDEGGAQS